MLSLITKERILNTERKTVQNYLLVNHHYVILFVARCRLGFWTQYGKL
jgi:hypothetical protein